ncbi:hypothetical protein GJAV_G00144300 [Gymnothorax javanicus]|nr:hypothetical protein GJAV_G00144300 [Gymnothorax javanicus]
MPTPVVNERKRQTVTNKFKAGDGAGFNGGRLLRPWVQLRFNPYVKVYEGDKTSLLFHRRSCCCVEDRR